jgi:hypothetical protein
VLASKDSTRVDGVLLGLVFLVEYFGTHGLALVREARTTGVSMRYGALEVACAANE